MPLQVADVLRDVESMVQPQLTERLHTYAPEPVDPALRVAADPEKLEQILLNLLSNAVKFTPRGGRIALSAAVAGADVEIRVSDTGVGIPPDKTEAIFDPFVQLPLSGNTREGTGLGLAIGRDLARGMGGGLTVRGNGTGGSTFVLQLPRA